MLTPSIHALDPPPSLRGRFGAMLCCVAYLCSQVAGSLAQEPEPASGSPRPAAAAEGEAASLGKPPPAPDPAGRVQYVGPDTYILLDAEGRPQAMPGMTYEDFMAAWKQAQQSGPHERQPRFTIEDVQINGTAGGDHAELRFEVTVRLLTDEPVDVPLGLSGAILSGQPRFGRAASAAALVESGSDGSAEGGKDDRGAYCDFDPDRGGYVAHFAGRPAERRTVTLELFVPLARDGAETTLALNCPRALAAKMSLEVDAAVTDASVSSGALVSREALEGGGTRLKVVGQAGQFRLAWSTGDVAAAELSTVLSATGAIQVSIDGRSVRTDARITVRSYGSGFDRFRIRLPRGAKLIQDRATGANKDPGFRISIDDQGSRGDARPPDATGGDVVLVELPEKQQGPVMVALSTEQPLELVDEDLAVELSGFEVPGAVRQFGDVALAVADDWQLRWDSGQYVRQVDPGELDTSLQQTGLTAAFQYDRQPWSLGVRVAARRFRIQVTPDYELECLPDEARLRVHLTYQILGARAFKFRVDLKGWELAADPLESGGLVDRDRLLLTGDGQLELPLLQPSSRRAEITFFVRRAVPRDARRLSLPLPVPVTESISTGDLAVVAAPGIELMPDTDQLRGLTPSPVVGTPDAATGDDRSEFRYRCFLPDALFVAERVSRKRDVAVDIAAQVDLRDSRAQVRERVDYTVRFEPITELVFDVPSELRLEDTSAEVALVSSESGDDGRDESAETLLMFVSDADDGEAVANAPTRHVRVSLPQPRLGRFAVEWRYAVSRPRSSSLDQTWSVPLAQPVDGRLGEMRATVVTPRDLTAALDPAARSAWKALEPRQPSARQEIGGTFAAGRPESSLPLVVHAVDPNAPSATTVDRAWLQTWISGNMRQERAAFRFRTTGELITVELPPETADEDIEVLMDRQPADVASREGGRMAVRIAPAADDDGAEAADLNSARPHTLELRYRRTSLDRVLTRRRLTPPQIIGRAALAEVYWQIVLPGDRHVVQSPAQLAAASEWQWLDMFLGRRPLRAQPDLEEWVGASAQLAPSTAQNEYLFSGLAPISSIEVVTAPRWLVVLAASGGVLALALVWIYVPTSRRRWIVAAAACLLAVLAIAYPTPALLLAQASVLGLALAVLAALIARLGARQTQWYLPTPGGSSHRQLTPRAESVVMPALASAVASTAPSAPLRVSESER